MKAPASIGYVSRGKTCSWPSTPGDWLTSKSIRVKKREPEEVADWEIWIGARLAPAANDNNRVVLRPDDGPVPGRLAEVGAADGQYEDVLPGTLITRNLAGTDAGATLDKLAELLRPADLIADNDNNAEDADDETANGGWGLETKLLSSSVRPSIPALLEAYADGLRPRVTIERNGRVVRFAGGTRFVSRKVTEDEKEVTVDEFIEIGGRDSAGKFHGVQFFRGELIAYGQNGRRRRPWVDATEASRSLPLDMSEEEYAAALVAEEQSGALGYLAIGRQNAAAPYRYGQLAGISEPIGVGVGKTSAPAHDALSEIDRAIDAADLLSRLNADSLAVASEALDGESFSRIATARGFSESSASKTGKRIVIRALSEIKLALAA